MIISKKPRTILRILRGKQLGFALPLVILMVVILIVTGGAGYYFYKTSQEPKEAEVVKPEQVIDETVDWKTYQNEEYGFKFKYPEDFYVKITDMVRIEKISDFPEEPELGPSLGAVLEERDSIYNSDVDDDCIGASKPQGIKSYCKIKQFNQIKGKLEKYYIGEDPSFGIKFTFYKNGVQVSLATYRALPELYPLGYEQRIIRFNEYFDSVARRDSTNLDLVYYDTFKKILSTLEEAEVPEKEAEEVLPEKVAVPKKEETEVQIQKYNKVLYWAATETAKEGTYEEEYNYGTWLINLDGENKRKVLDFPSPSYRERIKVSPVGKIIFFQPHLKQSLWIADSEGNKKKIVDIPEGFSISLRGRSFIISDNGELVAYPITKESFSETSTSYRGEKVSELWIVDSDGANSEKIHSSKAVSEIDKETQEIISSKNGEELGPLRFSKDNKKLFAVSEILTTDQNEENGLTVINLEASERKNLETPKGIWSRVLVSPDEKKIIGWSGGHVSPNKIYLTDLIKNESTILTEDKNVTVIGWLSNEEIVYRSQEEPFQFPELPPIAKNYKKLNINTKEKTNLFILTDDIRGKSEILVDKNKLLYRTDGNLSTPHTLSELFIINLDGTNKVKLELVKDGLTIIGLIY